MAGDKTQRVLDGRVVSNKMDKTIVVLVERHVRHPIYGKYIKRSKKMHAHDADNICQIGDLVQIGECRPLSRMKSWQLIARVTPVVSSDVEAKSAV